MKLTNILGVAVLPAVLAQSFMPNAANAKAVVDGGRNNNGYPTIQPDGVNHAKSADAKCSILQNFGAGVAGYTHYVASILAGHGAAVGVDSVRNSNGFSDAHFPIALGVSEAVHQTLPKVPVGFLQSDTCKTELLEQKRDQVNNWARNIGRASDLLVSGVIYAVNRQNAVKES